MEICQREINQVESKMKQLVKQLESQIEKEIKDISDDKDEWYWMSVWKTYIVKWF